MTAPLCPTHQLSARYRETSAHVYQGRDFGPIWECPLPDCDARIGCHPDGSPKGELASAALRMARMRVHEAFDPLWREWLTAYPDLPHDLSHVRNVRRTRAYEWLAVQMGVPIDKCHIGMLDEEHQRREQLSRERASRERRARESRRRAELRTQIEHLIRQPLPWVGVEP